MSIFFIAHASLFYSLTKTRERERERPTHIVELLFCRMSGWYNANFSKKHDKNFSRGSQQFDKAQCKTSNIFVYGFQDKSSYGFVRTLAYLRGVVQKVFQIFK